MALVEAAGLTYAYGRLGVLQDLDLEVQAGSLYALIGANGTGKTTLMQILMGLRRPRSGRASVLGIDSKRLQPVHRQKLGYVAEGQDLPDWMRLEELEAFLRPLYSTWDVALARSLRERFSLDPTRRIGSLSRGDKMKAALLCALAPRPSLLVMDEPFTGMDARVRDDLVRGVLESAGTEGWTVLLCSHDIGEVEMLADWVGILENGRMRLSEPMERLHERFKRVEVQLVEDLATPQSEPNWFDVERNGRMLSFIAELNDAHAADALNARFSTDGHCTVRDATLREVFIALARSTPCLNPKEQR